MSAVIQVIFGQWAKDMILRAPAYRSRKDADCRFCTKPIKVGDRVVSKGMGRMHEGCAMAAVTALDDAAVVLRSRGYNILEVDRETGEVLSEN